jgi:MoxR-like ATPase
VTAATPAEVEARVVRFRERLRALREQIARVIVGHEEVVGQVALAILAGGHALLEGVPGIGKTLLVRTISQCLALKYSRIQFTPDLMPADITGTNILVDGEAGRKRFEFQEGPIFGNIVLADEINRATPKTQSALLESMQEVGVTVGGVRHPLPEPFFVLATQNPIEMEGTYPLSEAQLDRFFFKVEVKTPDRRHLIQVIERTTGNEVPEARQILTGEEILQMRALAREVPVAAHVADYVARLILATHAEAPEGAAVARKYLRYGASPRGAQALILASKILALTRERYNVSFADVREVALPALRHRLILNFHAEAEGVRPDQIVAQILAELPETTG